MSKMFLSSSDVGKVGSLGEGFRAKYYHVWSVLFAAVLVTSTSAQLKTCPIVYQTTNANGTPDLPGAVGTPCNQISGVPAGSCGSSAHGANAQCQFSIYWMKYVCCYEMPQGLGDYTTPGLGSTFATLGPGTQPTPQDLKPICPNGALASIAAYTNQPAVCNMTNLQNQGCPAGWTCVLVTNIANDYGQNVLTAQNNVGAALTPNICCKTTTLTSYTNVFLEAGLSPTFVPSPPTSGINLVVLATGGGIYLGGDRSYLSGQLAAQPMEIVTLTSLSTSVYYHIMLFDSTTNHDCWFVANYQATAGGTALPFTSMTNPTAPIAAASVYNAGTATSPLWSYSATYVQPINNIGSHRFVVLVWTTPKVLTFAPQYVKSSTMLNLNPGANGDFAPSTTAQGNTPGGAFTTVSALLHGKFSTILGTPIIGSYFYLST